MDSRTEFFSPVPTETAMLVLAKNKALVSRGLSLTPADAKSIAEWNAQALAENRLVEIGAGSVERIVEEFSASPYAERGNFASIVETITEAFCYLKREAEREVSDRAVIAAMREQPLEKLHDDGIRTTFRLYSAFFKP